MKNRSLSTTILALTLAVPAVVAFADQPFGRDSVYTAASAGGATTSAAPMAHGAAQPNGRDTVSAARVPGAGASGASTAEIVVKPGRA